MAFCAQFIFARFTKIAVLIVSTAILVNLLHEFTAILVKLQF